MDGGSHPNTITSSSNLSFPTPNSIPISASKWNNNISLLMAIETVMKWQVGGLAGGETLAYRANYRWNCDENKFNWYTGVNREWRKKGQPSQIQCSCVTSLYFEGNLEWMFIQNVYTYFHFTILINSSGRHYIFLYFIYFHIWVELIGVEPSQCVWWWWCWWNIKNWVMDA